MPNTKEVEQIAESIFPTPDNPDARSLRNIDVVINCRSAFKGGYNYALSPLEQSEKKEEWVSVTEYNKLKDSFEELLSATVKMLYSGNHDKSAEITKNVWREKAGLPSPLTPCKH